MKKRIGIVTLQGATNYGAVLQAYALQEYLKKIGYYVEIINYYDNSLYGYYSPKVFAKPLRLKTIIGKIFRYKRNREQFMIFEKFRTEKLQLTPVIRKYEDLTRYSKKFDILIVGSDQVWNSKINYNTKEIFYLNFSDTAKKYSYAASAGNIDSIISDYFYITNYLSKFNDLSIRENDLGILLKKKFNINSSLVCDPTLLLTKDEWKKIEEKYEINDDFILVYMLNENGNMIEFIDNLIKKKNMLVINLGKNISEKNKNIKYLSNVSPGQFVYLYNKATYVITNSFHGTAFSIIYDKRFITFGNGKLNSRMETLLKEFSLEEKFMNGEVPFEKQLEVLEKNIKNDFSCSYVSNSKDFINNIDI